MALSPTSSHQGTASALVLLSTTTRATDGTFDVASIDQTYNDLLLVVVARGTRAAVADTLALRFNNDSTAANYQAEALGATLAAVAASTTNAGTSGFIAVHNSMPAASSTANVFGVSEIWIHGYASTTWFKNALAVDWGNYNGATARAVDLLAGQWTSTAAITRVQLLGSVTANLLTGSQLRIYGRL